MLTVSELAKELDMSVQTVYRALNYVKQGETVKITEKHKGIIYFTDFGEKLVKDYLKPVNNGKGCLTEINEDKQIENAEILFLREQNKILLQELEKEREYNRAELERERGHSRKQAEELSDLSKQLTELTRNSQILLK